MNESEKSPDVSIRFATADDAEAVVEVLARSFDEYESRYTAKAYRATVPPPPEVLERMREGPLWVGLVEGRAVATVSAVVSERGVYVRGMAVVPEARGHRMGWRLLDAVEELARRLGASRLYLSSTPFLGPAIALYERFGFVRSEEGPNDLLGTPLFSMVKML